MFFHVTIYRHKSRAEEGLTIGCIPCFTGEKTKVRWTCLTESNGQIHPHLNPIGLGKGAAAAFSPNLERAAGCLFKMRFLGPCHVPESDSSVMGHMRLQLQQIPGFLRMLKFESHCLGSPKS